MDRRTRRSMLALSGAALGSLAGCAGVLDRGPETPDSGGEPTPATDSPTDTPDSLTLEAVEPPLAGPEVEPRTLTVYPESMALALRRAARIEGTYRTHATAFVEAPEPFWTRYDRVRITGRDAGSEAEGVYEMDAAGGIRYELLVGADRVTPSEDVDPTPVSDLSGDRHDLALDAIDDAGPRVYPETELGQWVRTEWFDGYWERDGTVYRGKEVQQTDAAFFSDQVWATVEMRETVGHPQVTFELRAPGEAARDALDPVLAEREKHQRTATLDDPSAAVREYLDGVDLLATHTAVFEPRFG